MNPFDFNIFLLPGNDGTSDYGWFDWLKEELRQRGFYNITIATAKIVSPSQRAKYYKEQYVLDEKSVLVGHSFGACTAIKWLEYAETPIYGLLLVDPSVRSAFEQVWKEDEDQRPKFRDSWDWNMDLKKVKNLAKRKRILGCETLDRELPGWKEGQSIYAQQLDAPYLFTCGQEKHFSGKEEPLVLENVLELFR